ncbi:MAG: lipopolysaccharide biosynthesis protein RfbH [Elusimicrobiales bacterium]
MTTSCKTAPSAKELEAAKNRALEAAAEYHRLRAAAEQKPFSPGDKISYGGRIYDEAEIRSLVSASLDFWLTAGPYAARLEAALAKKLGVKHCSLVNSGSSANLLAFAALADDSLGARAINPGDEVITPAACFPTTVAPIVQHGAVPVFVDVAVPQYNVDVAALKAALTKKTKAVFLAHTLGNPFNAEAVLDFCNENGLWLIEDNCDALGSRYRLGGKWRNTASFGHMSTLSFYPAHHITTGEGGAVCTNDSALKRIVESLRDWGRDCWCPSGRDNTCKRRFTGQFGKLPEGYDHKYVYSRFGYNLKMTDLQAAIGCAQIEKLDAFTLARKNNWKTLRELFAPLEKQLILPEPAENSDPSWFGFVLSVRPGARFGRNEIVRHLENNGVQTRMLFAGNILRHPCCAGKRGKWRAAGKLDGSDFIAQNTFWLGVYPGMSAQKLEYMADCAKKFAR